MPLEGDITMTESQYRRRERKLQQDASRSMHTNVVHTFAVCAYKDSPYLEECLRSVTGQTVKSEVICCTSTPSDYIRELTEKFNVPLYIRDGESNIREDWMFAYEKANGRFVTIAHQDDRYRSDYTENLLKTWKKYPDLLLFASDYITIRMMEQDGKTKAVTEAFNMVWLIKKILRLPLRLHFIADRTWVKKSCVVFGNSICCPSCTYNKERIGDDMFHSKYDFALDWDNLYELAGKKGRFFCSEKPLIAYRVHAAATTKACIEDNRRPADEMAMFKKMWPDRMVRILMHFYRKAYKEYEK